MQCVGCKQQFSRSEIEHRRSSPFKSEFECPRCKSWLKKSPFASSCQMLGVLVWLLWLAASFQLIQLSQSQLYLSAVFALILFCFSVPFASWQLKSESEKE